MRSSHLLAAAIVLFASASVLRRDRPIDLERHRTQRRSRHATRPCPPSGKQLPPGRGTVKDGATVYAQKCQSCHGPNGTGTRLHRGLIPLGNSKPVKIQGSLVPYATTVWDFINRAMPSTKPGSLTPDEVYAATALRAVSERSDRRERRPRCDDVPRIKMPNRDNFVAVETRLEAGTATTTRTLSIDRVAG